MKAFVRGYQDLPKTLGGENVGGQIKRWVEILVNFFSYANGHGFKAKKRYYVNKNGSYIVQLLANHCIILFCDKGRGYDFITEEG